MIYVKGKTTGRHVWDVIHITSKDAKSNLCWPCFACGEGIPKPKKASIATVKKHVDECTCALVPEDKRKALMAQLKGKVAEFRKVNDKDMNSLKKLRR
jgi:hypothetical protein